MKLLILLLALTTLSYVYGLKCKKCVYVEGSSDNEVMTMYLNAMTAGSDQDCKDEPGKVAAVDCDGPALPSGHEWRCGKTDLSTTLSLDAGGQTLSADMRMINRDCVPVVVAQDKYSEGCHPASDFEEELAQGFPRGGEGPQMGPLKGELCICTRDECNSATSHSAVMFVVLVMAAFVFFIKQ